MSNKLKWKESVLRKQRKQRQSVKRSIALHCIGWDEENPKEEEKKRKASKRPKWHHLLLITEKEGIDKKRREDKRTRGRKRRGQAWQASVEGEIPHQWEKRKENYVKTSKRPKWHELYLKKERGDKKEVARLGRPQWGGRSLINGTNSPSFLLSHWLLLSFPFPPFFSLKKNILLIYFTFFSFSLTS